MTSTAIPTGMPELEWDLSVAIDVATAFVAEGHLPCIVFGIVDGSGASEIFALSGPRQEAADDSVFFIASVTKAVVATAVMRYVDEGRLDLHAPLSRYLPDLRDGGLEGISAWHLLTHTSGLPDMPHERIRQERPTYARMLADTLTTRPAWKPGSRYEYNSSAWVLLSELMAQLSNVPWPQVLEQRLTGPVGMVDTTFDARSRRRRVVAVDGVSASNPIVGEILLWFLARAAMPGGGLFGTAPDLLRLGWALLAPDGEGPPDRPHILSREAVAAMAAQQTDGIPHVAADGSVTEVQQGLGWRRSGGDWPAGDGILTHGGRSGARLWVDLERDFAFVFLTNVWAAPSDAAIAVLRQVYRARA